MAEAIVVGEKELGLAVISFFQLGHIVAKLF
jgi:hypothetical protein